MAKSLYRRYRFNDGELKQAGDLLVMNMERDDAAFAARNIGATERDGLADALEAFSALPEDAETDGFLTAAIQNKNELAAGLRVSLRSIRSIVQSRYGLTGAYRRFGFAALDKMGDDGLYRLARRVVRIGTALLAELAQRGLTAAMLSELSAAAQSFDDAIEAVQERDAERQNATEARITAGNAVWALMVEYAAIGKGLFVDTDAARYDDYVLTD